MLQVERGREEGYGADISILLTEARYELHVESALVHSISCEGRVINCRGKPYDGVDVRIEFNDYERNRHGEVPERAYFGEFSYWLKVPDEEYSSAHFTFHLRRLPEDARDFIIPMLTQALENEVILTINLTNEEEELLEPTDKLSGSVRNYSFEVRRRLRTMEDDERQVIKDDEKMDNSTDENPDTLTEDEAQSLAREWIDNCIAKPQDRFRYSQTRSLMDDLAKSCIAESLRNRENKDGLCKRLYDAWNIVYSIWRATAPEYATKVRQDDDDQQGEEETRKIEDAHHVVWSRRDPYLLLSLEQSHHHTNFNFEAPHSAVCEYLERSWLRHPFLDWILVDMLVSWELCTLGNAVRQRLAPRKREPLLDLYHRYFMRKRNPTKMTEKPDRGLKPFLLWDEMYEVWLRLRGPVINPSRVREAMVRSAEHGAEWGTLTWSLIDRVIAIDPAV